MTGEEIRSDVNLTIRYKNNFKHIDYFIFLIYYKVTD